MRPLLRHMLVLALSVVLAVGVTKAQAVTVGSEPTWPIPPEVPAGPPPIAALPAASATVPPADAIADPVTPGATCGGWYQQSDYGGRWPTGTTWWEYRCSDSDYQYHNTCPGPACDAYCPSCWWETWEWADYFYWDGAQAVFYGEAYSYSYSSESEYYDGTPPHTSLHWWDAPTAQWYQLGPFSLTVFMQGTGAGTVVSSPGGISCGWTCQVSFEIGTTVALTATPHASSEFTGWSGACSGTGTCQVAMDQARSVTATFDAVSPPPNIGPTASFVFACSSLSCTVDGTASADSDGTIAGYGWDFGDQSGGSGQVAHHTYRNAGTYPVTLTVTDDRGATATVSQAIAVTNAPPTASFTVRCTGLSCSLDGSASADPDGIIARWLWTFGDGTSGSGATTAHSYPKAGTYTVILTVTDDAGANSTHAKTFNPISVSARGYKANGRQKVDLSWNGVDGASYDVFRNGMKIATLSATTYTDTVDRGAGTYTYEICAVASSICSNAATVNV